MIYQLSNTIQHSNASGPQKKKNKFREFISFHRALLTLARSLGYVLHIYYIM